MNAVPAPVLAALLDARLGQSSFQEVLTRFTVICRDAAPEFEEVSITIVRQDKPFTAAHSGELALIADELQYERGYGPCIDAAVSGTVMEVRDMRLEQRWPDYAAAVVPHGVLSSLSLPLPLQTDVVAALNCYARVPEVLNPRLEIATELAAHAAVAVANAFAHNESSAYAQQMLEAMQTRAVIEQAKGVIMAQSRCDEEHAFEVLRRASMGRNVKLRDLAQDIVGRVAQPPEQPV